MENNIKKYDIYSFNYAWSDDKEKNNGSGVSSMFKEDMNFEQALEYAIKWWNEYIINHDNYGGKTKLIDRNPKLKHIKVIYVGKDTWCIGWFSHYTYNIHLDDNELKKTFRDFINRKMDENLKNGHGETGSISSNNKTFYCLMGANDEWRWKGPCRCKDCIKQGVVRIDH